MDKKYSTRSNFSENMAVGIFMKTRVDKMVVIKVHGENEIRES